MTNEVKEPGEKSSEDTSGEVDLSLEESPEKSPSNSQTDGQGSEVEFEDIEIQPAPGAPEYQHPLLKGKSPEEIERIVQTQEEAIRQQNDELNVYHDKLQAASSAPPPAKEEEGDDDYGDDFLAPRFKRLEQKLSKQLENAVKPLVEHTKKAGASSVRDDLRQSLKHFSRLEPYIDQMIRNQGGAPHEANEASLRFYYFAALGLAEERGVSLDSGDGQPAAPTPTQEDPKPGQTPVNIPQHRPSSAPLPRPAGQDKPRALTEAERRLAAEYFPIGSSEEIKTVQDQHKAYREWQDKEIDEVVEPGFSKESW